MPLTQYQLNREIDYRWRGQTLAARTTIYIGMMIVMPTRSTSGTEASTGAGYTGYARQSFTLSLANVSGTQSDGSTAASSGTRDYITNNVAITFSASLAAAWPSLVALGFFDASTAGNLEEWQPITDDAGTPTTITRNIGEAMTIAAGKLRLYLR
jgi:hypothetical protein